MVIREDLTQYKLKLLKDEITKMGRNGRVWTTNGTIFCKYDGEGRTVKIEKLSDIAKLALRVFFFVTCLASFFHHPFLKYFINSASAISSSGIGVAGGEFSCNLSSSSFAFFFPR
ncbi:unnamed protein product [Acanthoscelides obtectus]|uniref:Uncharacterized protein n=1 Tax=Acanthoscelides obtectus TaxID=200917 RepID=A0A9P0VT23_ACAOB|nr:unnamed protein product [Acanthoscelides obtectus]CAK1688709.1 hypothetical protein AOBTE_LOCUS36821 [Acanthoscelides obtectus]